LLSTVLDAIVSSRLDSMRGSGMRTAAGAEKLLRKAARDAGQGWRVLEIRGRGGRARGKGSHRMVGFYDTNGVMLAWTTIPQHPGDLTSVVVREIEATFEPYLGKGWMDK
jgi:hypothetical protein